MNSCVNCGEALPEKAKECPACGAAVKQAKSKKAKIGWIAVIAAVLIACVIGILSRIPPSYQGEDVVVYGSFDDTAYQNEYFGVQLNLPDGWRFETYEEIADDDKTDYRYEDSGVPYEQGKDWKYYYDAVLSDENTYSKIIIAEFPQDEDFPDAASVLDYYADTKAKDPAVVGRSKKYYTTKAGGRQYQTCNVQYDLVSYKVHSGFFVTEQDGWYMLINVVLTDLDGGTPDDYIKQLQPYTNQY